MFGSYWTLLRITKSYIKPLILAGFTCCNGSCYQQERNCQKFTTGTFEFETLLNGDMAKTTFVRNDTLEIDYFQGKADSSSIRWINNCEYIVQKINPRNRKERKAIHMKILTTDKDYYTFEYALVGKSEKQKGTARKISASLLPASEIRQ